MLRGATFFKRNLKANFLGSVDWLHFGGIPVKGSMLASVLMEERVPKGGSIR